MQMPQKIINLLNDPEATKVLTSVSTGGVPHSVVVGSIMAPESNLISAAEILMQTTSRNLRENPNVSVLVVKGMESYRVVAIVKAHQKDGPLFDSIKEDLEKKGISCRGIWLFEPAEAYNQSAGPDAGKKINE